MNNATPTDIYQTDDNYIARQRARQFKHLISRGEVIRLSSAVKAVKESRPSLHGYGPVKTKHFRDAHKAAVQLAVEAILGAYCEPGQPFEKMPGMAAGAPRHQTVRVGFVLGDLCEAIDKGIWLEDGTVLNFHGGVA